MRLGTCHRALLARIPLGFSAAVFFETGRATAYVCEGKSKMEKGRYLAPVGKYGAGRLSTDSLPDVTPQAAPSLFLLPFFGCRYGEISPSPLSFCVGHPLIPNAFPERLPPHLAVERKVSAYLLSYDIKRN
jgi:hypothetical protein